MYRNKAELNQECAEICKYFQKQQEFRIIIFTKFEMVKNDTSVQAKEIVHGKEDETNILLKKLENGVETYGLQISRKKEILDQLDKILKK